MARKKKPTNETEVQRLRRIKFESVANHANRSEKTSWNRKMDNMVKVLSKLRPIEQKILDIILEEKTPLMDEINGIRNLMIKECVHPLEYLIEDGDIVRCKFCETRIGVRNGEST